MSHTATAPGAVAPVVSLLAACGYCSALTAFHCLNCAGPMCADCVTGDYCPDCRPGSPAPANIVHFASWKAERDSYPDDVAIVPCAGCDRPVANADDAPAETVYCPECTIRPARSAACQHCGNPINRGDADADAGTRHAWCARFLARLDARWATRKESPIAV